MKFFLRAILLLALSCSFIFASDVSEIKKILLKKDVQKEFLVKYADKEKLFKFRWTLYKNGGLVIFRSYDRIVAQNVLYLRHENQSFRVELKTRGMDSYNVPYLLVVFKEFKQDTKEALFEILLFDDKKQIFLEELKK